MRKPEMLQLIKRAIGTGATISQLRNKTNLSRETITKYIFVLEATKQVRYKMIGNARFYEQEEAKRV